MKPITHILVHTGQHYDEKMSKLFFDELEIPRPDYNLEVGSGSHAYQTGEIMKRFEEVLLKEMPDVVIVVGDVNSTLACALVASKIEYPITQSTDQPNQRCRPLITHVEAGLRSFNKSMPEEINRILTDHISSILFCPSENAVKNLQYEGFKNIVNRGKLISNDQNLPYLEPYLSSFSCNISYPIVINVGDVMYDVFLSAVKIVERRSSILENLGICEKGYYLLTLHRAGNTDNLKSFEDIIEFVNNVSRDRIVIFPMHPRTRKIYDKSSIKFSSNVRIIDPVGYFDILTLLKSCELIMTDSGGMQKEAYWLKVPCITLREGTEWVETIESGWNILYKNYDGVHHYSHSEQLYYGEGNASEKIVNILARIVGGN